MAFKNKPGFEARNSFLAANSLRNRAYGACFGGICETDMDFLFYP